MKHVFLLLFISGIASLSFSQDLILNGNFEDVNICSEFNQPCSCHAWRLSSRNLPTYSIGENKYVTLSVCNSSIPHIRSYLESRLADTLIAGETYRFSMDVKAEDQAVKELGILFSDKLIFTGTDTLIDEKPDIVFGDNVKLFRKSKKGDWVNLETEFVAGSEYNYIIIGCFGSGQDLMRIIPPNAESFKNYYYSFDNIKLVSENNLHDPANIEQTKQIVYSQHKRHPIPEDLFSEESFKLRAFIITEPEVTPEQVDTIVLSNTLLFGFDSYEITDVLAETLDSVFSDFSETPQNITITGHTDNVGNKEYNEELSLKRAKSIAAYLDEKGILSVDKITCFGEGSNMPVDDNSTEEGRQNNRRVEIIVRY